MEPVYERKKHLRRLFRSYHDNVIFSALTMTLDQLQGFVAIVEHGSIRAAARELGLAQSGLTQQLKRLEIALNAELFVRGHSGITLTPAGNSLLARARIVLTECARAEAEIAGRDRELIGSLSVGASSEAFSGILLPIMVDFRRRYPKISVHLASGPAVVLMSRIREANLDFAITLVAQGTDMSDLSSTVLGPARPAIVCRRDHPLEHATSLSDLAEAEWVNTGRRGRPGAPENRLYDFFTEAGLEPPKVVVTVESLFDTLNLVANSDLLFLAPSFVLKTAAYERTLTQIPVEHSIPRSDLSLLQRADAPLPPAAKEIAAMAVSYARMKRNR
ncbi:LysR substrate-binding domain-containing protein [Caballeronia glebae]|uniref:LysR substrate-binding domain-containing protein n=1 Tax=Caballeronia glebae TaxID=1777143 RepID=UPI0038B7AE06